MHSISFVWIRFQGSLFLFCLFEVWRVRAPVHGLVARFIRYQHIAQAKRSTHAQQEHEKAILHAPGKDVSVVLGVVGEFGWTSLDPFACFLFFRQLVGEASLWFHFGSKYLVNVLVELLVCGSLSSVHKSFL
ncbi:hypothetical protein OPV22_013489 [Ensete ventricosum]|uniref:Secreted protein n=1 Tax=Ensete ventricosum TaxID=4639 RepID=A0AAV8PIN9_ENSVE|nr:hypothetical protein OPV22_013489 [Ensete ventricosum]